MIAFLRSYSTLFIAALALLQPWLLALYRKFFRQGRIEIYETGNLEIGYTGFGPTIGIIATLRCIDRDFFVRTIQLELVKHKDQSKHAFQWGVFRDQKITIGTGTQGTLELPFAFMLSTLLPQRLNIQFQEMQRQSEIQGIIYTLTDHWAKERIKAQTETGESLLAQILSQKGSLPQEFQDPFSSAYEKFRKSPVYIESFDSVSRICYWEAGKYNLKIIVRTSKPDRSFEKNWDFVLNQDEVKLIRLNVVKLFDDACGRPSYGAYYFAFPKYE